MRATVWDHFSFTKLSDVKGEYEANCKYCNKTHYKEWSLKRKAFSITCDNARAMDVMVARLKPDLLSFGTLPVAGRFFHVRCSTDILNLIVQSGITVIDKSVLKLHEAVNYIAASDACLCTLEKCVSNSKCNFVGKLRLYCSTRWNSTYLMLKSR
ncbi:putative AC transposase [Bienertia sinuspersici]